jgi:hypothetical protein
VGVAEVLPQVVVHPPKREKKRRPVPVRPVLCKAVMEPEWPNKKTEWGPCCSLTLRSFPAI